MSDIPDWVHIGETADGLPINQYFADNPDMVLGAVVEGNKLYGSGTMVVAEDGFDLKSALHEAVSKLSAEISHERDRDVYANTADGVQLQIPSNLRNYSFFLSDDQVFFKKNNAACEFRFDKGTAQHKRFTAFIELRDLTRELIEAMELELSVTINSNLMGGGTTACLRGAASHTTKLIESFAHNLNRLESALYNIDGRIDRTQADLAKLRLDHQTPVMDFILTELGKKRQSKVCLENWQHCSLPVMREPLKNAILAATRGVHSIGNMNEQEMAVLQDYIENVKMYRELDPNITAIIREEAGKYFSLDCTAESAAKSIQGRVSLYLSEQE